MARKPSTSGKRKAPAKGGAKAAARPAKAPLTRYQKDVKRVQREARAEGRRLSAKQAGKVLYQKRIAKGRAAGKTRQESRGKPPREHVGRREKEQQRVISFAAQQTNRELGAQFERVLAAVQQGVDRHGLAWLTRLEKFVAEHHERWKNNRYRPLGIDIASLAAKLNAPHNLLFYH